MKLLHVITGLNVGGAEGMLARLVEHCRLLGDESEIVSLMRAGAVGERIRAANHSVQSLGMTQGWPSLSALLRLAGIVHRTKPDAVMAWMHHAQAAASLALPLQRHRPPLIWNVRHSLNGFAEEKRLTRITLRALAACSAAPAAIVYNSRTAAGQYRALGFAPHREVVIPNGFALPAPADSAVARSMIDVLYRVPSDTTLVGMIARAHPMKDVPNLVAAFAKVIDAGLNAHLLLVGEGMADPYGAVAESLAMLPRRCWSVGPHSAAVGEWLPGLDMLVLPSAWGEGFSNVIGEAMAAGVSCIATDVGDARHIIGATGHIVPPRDPAALAAALIETIGAGASQRAARGRRARDRIASCFAIDEVVGRYRELFAEVAAGRDMALAPAAAVLKAIER